MAKFHFVEDYQKNVKNLMALHPIDEAMSLAVGGGYATIGEIEKDILLYAGLKQKMHLLDYGCGSGRLASALSPELKLEYLGIDIVDELLEYAATKSPKNYKFINHQELNIPSKDEYFDMICAFSLFTHLLQAETYLYLRDMHRVLKKDGVLVFSFLEFDLPAHWSIFEATVEGQRNSTVPHLNMFMEKSVINIWAEKLGYKVIEIICGTENKFNGKALGQSLAILKK
ncbi:MAG: hypothetical protein Ta2B_15580 [Termitinemataceae bacterium]|nr:MAG: hypothetical protein Ta2B_15580 [Termitinemataceae bacterium]